MSNKTIIAIGQTAVISRALYDDLARERRAAHEALNNYNIPACASLVERIEIMARYGRMREEWPATWPDLQEYQEWLHTVDDAGHRTQ